MCIVCHFDLETHRVLKDVKVVHSKKLRFFFFLVGLDAP